MERSFEPEYMPCGECGASVQRARRDDHVCEAERLVQYRLFQLRDEIGAFDAHLTEWLDSPAGRFASWYAERARRRGSPPPDRR